MLTILFLASAVVAGTALAGRGLRSSPVRSGPLERAAAAGTCALALAVAVSWTLSLLKILTRPALLAAAAVMLLAGAWSLARRRRSAMPAPLDRSQRGGKLAAAALLPLVVWFAFSLYRGYRLPVSNFDALSYHLPKSVFLMQSHGYGYLQLPDYRLNYPCDYELLLADSLVLEGSDRWTGPLSTLFFGLFLLLAAALAEQWWGDDLIVITTTVLAIAATPVLLLHSSVHKNDLLMSAALLAGFLWLGRWVIDRRAFSLALTLASFAVAIGTKGQAIFAAAAGLPVLAATWIRRVPGGGRPSLRQAVGLAVGGLLAGVFLGGVPYAVNAAVTRSPFAFPAAAVQQPGYGDWANLVTFPILLAFAPFSPNPHTVFVPWRRQEWFWPKYDLYFSNFGMQWILALLLLATVLLDSRARRAFSVVPRGARVAGIAAAAGWFAMLPMRLRPIGHSAGFPRSMIFIAAVVLVACCGAMLSRSSPLSTSRWRNRVVVLGAAIAFFVSEAGIYATRDVYGPLSALSTLGGTRKVFFAEFHADHRAPELLDRFAGDRDVVAVDAGLFTWLYPLWGARFTRTVQILPDSRPDSIRADARWVVVDRTVGVHGWDDPEFHDMSEFLRNVKRCPRPEEVLLLERLENDSRFRRVYYDPEANQAIFARK